MQANVLRSMNQFGIQEVAKPRAGVGEAVVRVTFGDRREGVIKVAIRP
jgi:hypothetical protein